MVAKKKVKKEVNVVELLSNLFNRLSRFWQDTAERAVRTFMQGYFGNWLIAAAIALKNRDFDGAYTELFTLSNLRTGVVMVALSVAMSTGLKKYGNPNSASILSVVGNAVKRRSK